MSCGECRNDQAGENQVDAHQLHGCGNREREQCIKTNTLQVVTHPVPGCNDKCADDGHRQQLIVVHPENLADEQFLQVFAPVRVIRQQQQPCGCREYERNTNKRFLDGRPVLVCPVKYPRGYERRRHGGNLYHPPLGFPAHRIRGDDAETRYLRDGEIDKNNATP